MTVNLHDSVVGDGPDVVLLHGLFGMGSNLGSLARALQDRYRVHSVDLPNHGHSGWLDDASLAVQAQCVAQWMDERQLHSANFVGHSLGGKVAMQVALLEPLKVDALVVADIAPVSYPGSHDDVFAALDAVAGQSVRSRAEAGAHSAARATNTLTVRPTARKGPSSDIISQVACKGTQKRNNSVMRTGLDIGEY